MQRLMIRRILTLAAFATASATAISPALACAPVTIYFDWNSSRVNEESSAAIERLAVALAWKGPELQHILLSSFTDASGSAAANRAVSRRRAEAVRDVLVSYHVPADRIAIQALGDAVPRVATRRGVREPRNRRVELLIQMSAEGQARQLAEGQPIC
jgi:outer membrane protein OmpA-like peptidoglycan-associated protein